MMGNTEAHHEGWCNEATWMFNLYFFQERKLYEAIIGLIKSWGNNKFSDSNYAEATNLMRNAYTVGQMEPMDEAGGVVNVREIVQQLAVELSL